MTELERVIQLCDQPNMGVEQLNARSARLGEFDLGALAGWLHMLSTGTDIERAARRSDISSAAHAALRELAPRVYQVAAGSGEAAERVRYLVPTLKRMFSNSDGTWTSTKDF